MHAISIHSCIADGNVHYMFHYILSNFSQPRLEIEIGLQADEWSETIYTAMRVDDTCTCSSLHVQGTFTYTDSHRCPLHNDTMEHDCTGKNIVPGLIVPSDGQLDTPQAVEDWCICTSLHIHGNSVNVCYYHPVDTLEDMDVDTQPVEDMDTEDVDTQTVEDMDTEDIDTQSDSLIPVPLSYPQPVENCCASLCKKCFIPFLSCS